MLRKLLLSTLPLFAALACNSLPSLIGLTPTPTYPCPQATAEILYVEPVPPTTTDTSVIVVVHIGYGESVSITTESGTFTAAGSFDAYNNPARVKVDLLPNTIHHLQVSATVAKSGGFGGCSYGGYTLSATYDRDGNPLVVEQKTP